MARGVRIGAKSDVVATLRSLLRAARSRSPAKSVRQSAFAQEILSQYRQHQHEADRGRMRALRGEATDYLAMLQGVEEQKFLWDLDAGAETKLSGQEIVNLAAKRVGLTVPDELTDDQHHGDEEARKRAAAAQYLAAKRAKEQAEAQ